MKQIELPYGDGHLTAQVPERNLKAVLSSQLCSYNPGKTQEQLVREALQNPVESAPLHELARHQKKVVIISSDHTRPVPSRILMPRLLEEVRRGNPQAEITILVATGCHRSPTQQELLERYGAEIVQNERICIHDCDAPDLRDFGELSSGNRLLLNPVAADADLLLAEGFIEPHFFAGFSGGRKAVLPGIAGRATVMYNHCARNIASDRCRTGILNQNPIQDDMCEAAERAKLRFILNVVINDKKQIVGAFSGDPVQAHAAGVNFLKSLCQCPAALADIVLATNGGAPLDQNIYQCVKGMSTAEMTCRKGGVIVMASRCNDGHGGQVFFDTFSQTADNEAIMASICARDAGQTIPDQWQSQIFLRILLHYTVIFVSETPREMVEALHMVWAPDLNAALKMAFDRMGSDAAVTAVPDAVSTMILPAAEG